MTLSKPIIPKEHGAWAILLVPLFIGAAHGGGWNWQVLLFLISSLGIFLGYLPAQTLLRAASSSQREGEDVRMARRWLLVYLSIAAVSILPVIVLSERWLLLPIGLVGMAIFVLNFFLTRGQGKTIPADLAAVVGLTLTAPAAYYVASGTFAATALVLWLLNILFFGSTVFYVHMRIRALAAKKVEWGWKDRFAYGGVNLAYHVVMVGILMLLAFNRLTPTFQLLAFAPMTLNAVWGTLRLASSVNLKKLGFTLLTHSLAFLVLTLILVH